MSNWKHSEKNLLSSNQKYEEIFFLIFGGGGVLTSNVDLITMETYVQQGKTINNRFFIYSPECDNKFLFDYLGGGGGLWDLQ